jgi:hypothetical protein
MTLRDLLVCVLSSCVLLGLGTGIARALVHARSPLTRCGLKAHGHTPLTHTGPPRGMPLETGHHVSYLI